MIEIKISLNDGLEIKDLQDSKLGWKIRQNSILWNDDFGFESFTFRKLVEKINSSEASIYRYFKSKHPLLLFLTNWYWECVYYFINFNTMNVDDPRKKPKIGVHSFIFASKDNLNVDYVYES